MEYEELLQDTEACEELIKDLVEEITEYGEQYVIIPNPDLEFLSEKDAAYLRFPYAVRLWISTDFYGDYGETLYVNENWDGLEFRYEDTSMSVDKGWLYYGYSNKLSWEILRLQDELNHLRSEFNKSQIENGMQIRKLEDRLVEKGIY